MASERFLDADGLAHVLTRFKETYTSLHAVSYKEMVDTISTLPSLDAVKIGYMYGIRNGGLTTDDFVGGAGQTIYDGDNVICVNINTEEEPVLKWDSVGGMVNISDRLQFGNAFPANPVYGDTFLYMGETIYQYGIVTPVGYENPSEKGWYEYNSAEDKYVLSADTEVNPEKTYYVKSERYSKGVIYVYSLGNIWAPQTNGDIIDSIDKSDIEALFA